MGITDGVAILKKRLYLFFVLDSSGSMQGANIQAVNTACKEAIESDELRNIGADVYVGVLEFNNGCRWMTQEPIPIDQFQWQDLTADGGTDLGLACRELDKKLRKDEYLQAPAGLAAPAIILMSDGEPTDDFGAGLSMFKQNKYYKQTIKVAIAVDNANEQRLAEFTGSKEAVIKVRTPEALAKWIRVVTLTVSGVGAKNQGASNGQVLSAQDEATNKIQEAAKEDPSLEGVDPDNFE
jgi:uncharacterized protein YegL